MKNNSTIAIIGAMDCEIETFKSLLMDIEEIDYCDLVIFIGKYNNNKIILAKSGVGKVNAALNTQYIIDNYKPNYIINTGVAGGVGKNLNVGDIVVADKLVHHDFDVTALGYAKGYICNGIEPQKPTYFYPDKELVNDFVNVSKTLNKDFGVHIGTIATGDTFVASVEKKDELRCLFDALATEMEGAAIAQTATRNNIPFVVMRAISDLADGSAQKSLQEVETTMANFAASVTEKLLTELVSN